MSQSTHQPGEKEFTTAAARFALLGFALTRQARASDGRVTFSVSKAGQTYHLSLWGDVQALLTQLGGRQ